MPAEFLFPKVFYFKDDLVSESENRHLCEAARALRSEFPKSTRVNLYTPYGSIPNVLERTEFSTLRLVLADEIVRYLEILETRPGLQCVITDSWVSISSPGNYERMHTHDGAYISGVYYLQTSPDCGNLYFEELSDNLWASLRSRPENFNSVSYTPKETRGIFFNSRVPYHVGQNASTQERIALSFNVALQ